MQVLIIDNYDSFTYNLLHYVEAIAGTRPEVMRNDAIDFERAAGFSHMILSPGPGLPSESGDLMKFITHFRNRKHIWGICLGHQAIAESYGAKLKNLDQVKHGVSSPVHVITEDVLYRGIASPAVVGRYHSWVIAKETMPADLLVTAADDDGEIMSFRHRELPLYGVQFHPESVMTVLGKKMVANWLNA